MNLNTLATAVLPAPLYQRLSASSIAKRLARGALWNLLGTATSRVLVLVAMILVARILGKTSFGEFGLIQATLGVAGLMAGFGLGGTATRFVAQYAATDPDRAGRIIALVMLISWGTVLLAAGVLIATSSMIATQVLGAPHLRNAMIWGALLMAANVLRGNQSGIIAALERFDVIAKLNVLEGVVSLVTMVVMAHYWGVKGALLGLAIASIAVWLVGRAMLGSILRVRGIWENYRCCWSEWRILHGYSLPSLLSGLVATPVLWFCMTWVVQRPNGYAELGLYNAAYQWHGPMIFIPMILMSVSIPILVQEWESGQTARFRKVTFGIYTLTLACVLPPVLLISALSPWVMSIYGPEFRNGWLILVILLAAAPFHSLSKVALGALLGMNRAWWGFGCNLLWGMLLLLLTVELTPIWNVLGLAIAFLTAYCILSVVTILLVTISSSKRTHYHLCVESTSNE